MFLRSNWGTLKLVVDVESDFLRSVPVRFGFNEALDAVWLSLIWSWVWKSKFEGNSFKPMVRPKIELTLDSFNKYLVVNGSLKLRYSAKLISSLPSSMVVEWEELPDSFLWWFLSMSLT